MNKKTVLAGFLILTAACNTTEQATKGDALSTNTSRDLQTVASPIPKSETQAMVSPSPTPGHPWPRLKEAFENPQPDLSAHKPKDQQCLSYLDLTGVGLEMFHYDWGKYPENLAKLSPDYLKKTFVCPLGGTYEYEKRDHDWVLSCRSEHSDFSDGFPKATSENGIFVDAERAYQLWTPK